MKNTICYVDLSELPRIKKGGTKINWRNSVGCKVPFVYNDISDVFYIIEYIGGSYLKVKVKYKDKIMDIPTYMIANGNIGRLIGVITNDFKIPLNTELVDEHRNIIITDRKYIKDEKGREWKYYQYTCKKCGFDCGKHYSVRENIYKDELWVLENNILKGKGCSCCNSVSIVEGINDIPTTAPWMVDYFQGGYEEAKLYTYNSSKRIFPICPDCKTISEKSYPIDRLYFEGLSCFCKDGISYPNKFMYDLLKQLNIDFVREYRPDWCNNKPYDFYLPILNTIIEMDGGFHYVDNTINQQTKEERQMFDKYKDELANKHNIKVIRVNCHYNTHNRFNYVKNNVILALGNILNLENVNWEQCDIFALSNLSKKACMIKKENPNFSTVQIAKILDVQYGTVAKWLKQGDILGLCEYDVNIEKKKCAKRRIESSKKTCSKQVEIFKDGLSLGVFPSVAELSRKSEKLFGVKLSTSCISAVCTGKGKTAKGYTFKYIET